MYPLQAHQFVLGHSLDVVQVEVLQAHQVVVVVDIDQVVIVVVGGKFPRIDTWIEAQHRIAIGILGKIGTWAKTRHQGQLCIWYKSPSPFKSVISYWFLELKTRIIRIH